MAVRVPGTDDGDLATAASRRLNARDGIEAVDVVGIEAIEPTLAATVVRLEVHVRVGSSLDATAVEGRIADAPGVQRVDELCQP